MALYPILPETAVSDDEIPLPTSTVIPTFQEETWAVAWPEIQPLTQAHWLETQREHATMPLDIDVDTYAFMDARGDLSIVTVRVHGVLVGYCTSFLHYHLKSKQVRCAVLDAYYLDPFWRGLGWGTMLFTAALDALKARGVQRVFGDTKPWQDIGAMFERDGWLFCGRQYTKWIGD